MSSGRSVDGEGGWSVVEMPLAICLLLIPVACLVASLPTWLERQTFARVAARQAARIVATAPTSAGGQASADRVVAEMATNAGIGADNVRTQYEGALVRGGTVTASVTVEVPSLELPLIGSIGGFQYTASDTELVDHYRSLP